MNPFLRFMASTSGRVTRVLAGLFLLTLGLFVLQGVAGTVVAVIGLMPLLAGALDFCVLAPLFGRPVSGPRLRHG